MRGKLRVGRKKQVLQIKPLFMWRHFLLTSAAHLNHWSYGFSKCSQVAFGSSFVRQFWGTGRDLVIVQAVTRRFFTSEDTIWYQGSPCEFCSGQGTSRRSLCPRHRLFRVVVLPKTLLVAMRVETETANPQNINTPHRKKGNVEGVERKRGDRKKRVVSQTSCSTSCPVFTLVSLCSSYIFVA